MTCRHCGIEFKRTSNSQKLKNCPNCKFKRVKGHSKPLDNHKIMLILDDVPSEVL